MIIKFTPEERERLQAIRKSYDPEREALLLKIRDCTDKDERAQLRIQQQALFDRMDLELQAFSEQCQRERFAQITGGAAGIIAHAKEQAPMILEALYNESSAYFTSFDAEILNKTSFASMKGGKFYLNANYAAKSLRDELKMHIDALKDNKEALQELFAFIIETVEDSSLTDSTEITEDSIATKLEVLRFRRSPLADLNTYGLMNDKASAQLIQDDGIFKEEANGQMRLLFDIDQTPAAVKEEAAKNGETLPAEKAIHSYISLTYEGTEGQITKKLTAFDKGVYEAVATRFYHWKQKTPTSPLYITPQEIWRTMNGKRSGDGKAKPSKAQVQRICDSMDKMRFTRFYMDLRDEVKAYQLYFNDERIEDGYIDSYLVNSTKVQFTTEKGKVVTGYRINEEPILYTYNRVKKHILFVPYEMLDTSANTSDSENVTEFRNYLLQAVQLMKNGADESKAGRFKRSNRILLSDMYEKTGIQPPEERVKETYKTENGQKEYKTESSRQTVIRRTRKTDRVKVEGILTTWKDKEWIKDFSAVKKDHALIGYDIDI